MNLWQRTTYLVDSENVGSVWLELLPDLDKKDRIIIFYTENSPHFAVDSARLITEYKSCDITWKKCFTGNNALDFQLVSQLGYLLCKSPKDAYVILSNDTGYDAAVKFWQQEGMKVSRMRGDFGRQPERQTDVSPKRLPGKERTAETGGTVEKDRLPVDCVLGLCKSISIHKLSKIHEALVALLGAENGREVYYFLRDNTEFHEKLGKIYLKDKNARVDNYLRVLFAYHGMELERVDTIRKILAKYSAGNFDGMYKAMQGSFGKERGAKYYSVLKPHVRVIKKL